MQAVGFSCDYCKVFESSPRADGAPSLPLGWITVKPRPAEPVKTTDVTRSELHVCGNECLALLGIARFEAEDGGKTFRRPQARTEGRPKGRNYAAERARKLAREAAKTQEAAAS